jgi:hypothetical protein
MCFVLPCHWTVSVGGVCCGVEVPSNNDMAFVISFIIAWANRCLQQYVLVDLVSYDVRPVFIPVLRNACGIVYPYNVQPSSLWHFKFQVQQVASYLGSAGCDCVSRCTCRPTCFQAGCSLLLVDFGS